METHSKDKPIWLRCKSLRIRWGDEDSNPMPSSTFYDRMKKGQIPQPEYPFGPSTPMWRLEEIEAHENSAKRSKREAVPA